MGDNKDKKDGLDLSDQVYYSPEIAESIKTLRKIVDEIYERESADTESDAFKAWRHEVLGGLPETKSVEADEFETLHEAFELQATAGNRTYRVHAHIDEAFGSDVGLVRDIIQLMLQGMVQSQAGCFVRHALQHGRLTWRRDRNLDFPHPLPYQPRQPSDLEGRAVEEAAVLEAAIQWVMMRNAPGMNLRVNRYNIEGGSNGWATVNFYHTRRRLSINLNHWRLTRRPQALTASTAAHELLHNLGWSHPDGVYRPWMAIENYEHCIAEHSGAPLEEDHDQILH
jgi:hypothetical protein